MKINLKSNLKLPSFPLSIYNAINIADAIGNDGDHFSVFIGLDKKMVAQLKVLSLDQNDTEIQKNTSDKKRFGEQFYEDWYKKERTPFALVHTNTNTLAALIWFGPEPLVGEIGNWYTVAWRSYPSFRGKGLMKEFTKFAINVYSKNIPNIKFWIIVKKENAGSVGLAKFLGFQELEKLSFGNISSIMIK